jgi:hypothetical protein
MSVAKTKPWGPTRLAGSGWRASPCAPDSQVGHKLGTKLVSYFKPFRGVNERSSQCQRTDECPGMGAGAPIFFPRRCAREGKNNR